MNEPFAPRLIRVRDWDQLYENNRSRGLKRTDWFPAPNDLSSDSYVELVAHESGAAHLGIWIALLMVASKAKICRGLLIREDGRPHTAASLARVTRLPESLIAEAIERLLEMKLLESAEARPEINDFGPHPNAENSQVSAAKPHEGAAEGKGTEHHHQGRNHKEKKGTERVCDTLAPGHFGAASGENPFPKEGDDKKNPGEVYASPEDELKAIYRVKAGEPITVAVLDAIRLNLELNRVDIGEFVSAVRKHAENEWRNPAGFLRDLSKRFLTRTKPASGPMLAADAAEKNYRCPLCDSTLRGRGVRLIDGRAVPCSCASSEYIAEQQARGIFPKETSK